MPTVGNLPPWRGVSLIFVLALAVSVTGCFPKQAGPRLAHFDRQAPRVGERAPEFELRGLGGEMVALSSLVGDRPIVLQFGSHSCPVYRYRSRHWMRDLVADYGERVHFVLVYTIEAHPDGSASPYRNGEPWLTNLNRFTGVKVKQPESAAERRENAVRSRARLEIDWPILVDTMDNEVWSAWGGASSPAFVIDASGRVVVRQVWVQPQAIRAALEELLEVFDAP